MKRTILMLLPAMAVLLSGTAAVAEIQKWVDLDGQVHYGDQPPSSVDATPVDLQPNVIETDPALRPASRGEQPATPQPPEATSQTAPETRKDIQAYVAECRKNRGVDCESEAREMIDGPATVLFPGDPTILPRPDVKPPPPGLPLKFGITP